MALINHNDIKEVPVKFLIWLRSTLRTVILHKLLIETHKNLVTLIGASLLYLDHLLSEGFKVLEHCLVYQNVSIRQVENPHIAALAGLQETIQYLEGCICLTGACRHDEHHSLLPSGKGFDNSFYNYSLIVAWLSTIGIIIIWFLDNL